MAASKAAASIGLGIPSVEAVGALNDHLTEWSYILVMRPNIGGIPEISFCRMLLFLQFFLGAWFSLRALLMATFRPNEHGKPEEGRFPEDSSP